MKRRRSPSQLAQKQVEQKLAAAERDGKALALKLAGATHEQINQQLKYGGTPNVTRALRRELQRTYAENEETREHARELWLQRIERRLLGLEQQLRAVLDDDSISKEAKLAAQVKVSDAQARLAKRAADLQGLDAPTRNEHTGKNGGPILSLDLGSLSDEQLDLLSANVDPAAVLAPRPAGPGGDRAPAPGAGAGGPTGPTRH